MRVGRFLITTPLVRFCFSAVGQSDKSKLVGGVNFIFRPIPCWFFCLFARHLALGLGVMCSASNTITVPFTVLPLARTVFIHHCLLVSAQFAALGLPCLPVPLR